MHDHALHMTPSASASPLRPAVPLPALPLLRRNERDLEVPRTGPDGRGAHGLAVGLEDGPGVERGPEHGRLDARVTACELGGGLMWAWKMGHGWSGAPSTAGLTPGSQPVNQVEG